MSNMINEKEAAALLLAADRIAVLCHRNPDGDTVGCGFAMYYGLTRLGKKAMVCCSDPIPEKYGYFTCETESFTPDFVLAVDIADEKLLGDPLQEIYGGRCDLCLDHHGSNLGYAKNLCLRAEYGAACELVYDVLEAMGVAVDGTIADALYTGIATDTGCLRYSNTGVHTLRTAASLVEKGARSAKINNDLFETKSRSRMAVEQMALSTLQFRHGGRFAFMAVTGAMMRESGAGNEDMEGVAAIPRQIEGVDVAVTLRQQGAEEENRYKISVRTSEAVDASALCRRFGGGGHPRAAGCEFQGKTVDEICRLLSAAAGEMFEEMQD